MYHFLKVTVNGTNVTVTPINSLGQSFDVRNYVFSADAETTAPTTPGNLNATVASGTQINLSWSASSDNTGVRGYGIYRDGVLVNTVDKNTLSYSDTNLAPSTNYAYRVDAFDGSGNHSALSASRSATTQSTATYTFDSVADAYVAADFPSTNYGLSGTIRAVSSPEYRSYLRFVVNDISGTVTNATLRLYSTSSSSDRLSDQACHRPDLGGGNHHLCQCSLRRRVDRIIREFLFGQLDQRQCDLSCEWEWCIRSRSYNHQ